jgi:hypothetical protein
VPSSFENQGNETKVLVKGSKQKGGSRAMELKMARLCLDCEEIFEGDSICPRCGSESWHPIMGWIRPLSEADRSVVRSNDLLVLAKSPQMELGINTSV